MRLVGITLLAAGLSACATPAYELRIRYAGVDGFDRGVEAEERAQELAWDEDFPVHIIDKLPPGLMVDEQEKLRVAPGWDQDYEVIGTVISKHAYVAGPLMRLRLFFWFVDLHDQHSRARDAYCAVQGVLKGLTVGLWNIVPLAYPCFAAYSYNSRENRQLHEQQLRRAAHAMGANLVVIGKWHTTKESSVAVAPVGAHAWVAVPFTRGFGDTRVSAHVVRVSAAELNKLKTTAPEAWDPAEVDL